MNKRKFRRLVIVSCLTVGAYLFGAYSYPRDLWPLGALRRAIPHQTPTPPIRGSFDAMGRLIAFPAKTKVDCPMQTADTAVLLVIGQSNAANHAEQRITTRFPGRALNYFEGNCYDAASPLLGATGDQGEFATPLADDLIESGAYTTVIIVAAAIGATTISRWEQDGDANMMLQETIREASLKYKFTQVMWDQGESDFLEYTSKMLYDKSFYSMMGTLPPVPVYIAIATRCGTDGQLDPTGLVPHVWEPNNPVAVAQRGLIDNSRIFLGADMDALLTAADRKRDGCHMDESGQRKAAAAYAAAITTQSQR